MTMQTGSGRTKWWRLDYLDEPDFTRPLIEVTGERQERLLQRLQLLYGEALAEATLPELMRLLKVHCAYKPAVLVEAEQAFRPGDHFSEKDMMLITYGDMVRAQGRTGLSALGEFLAAFRQGEPLFSVLHVLPFFPYTSDRGFSVVDFRTVDPSLGSWHDIRDLGKTFRLMFDGVLNQCFGVGCVYIFVFDQAQNLSHFLSFFTNISRTAFCCKACSNQNTCCKANTQNKR